MRSRLDFGMPAKGATPGLRLVLLAVLALGLPGCFLIPTGPTDCGGPVTRIRTESLPDGVVGQPYTFHFEDNCSGTFTLGSTAWEVSGDLPPGIMLGPGFNGRLSGTPTVPGTFSFEITLSAYFPFVPTPTVIESRTFSLVVHPAP